MRRWWALLAMVAVLVVGVGAAWLLTGPPAPDPVASNEPAAPQAEPAPGAGGPEAEEPAEEAEVEVEEDEEDEDAPADGGHSVKPPDQPGWTGRVARSDYDVPMSTFVVAARRTASLGRLRGKSDHLRIEPFVLAALPWKDSSVPEDDEVNVAAKVVGLLRERKILSFANPVMLSTPKYRHSADTWMDERQAWIGIPVSPGTPIEKPLVAVEFPGADVLAAEPIPQAAETIEDWTGLLTAAWNQGRQPMFPLIYRFSGWRSKPKGPRYQMILPLAPIDAAKP